MLRGFHSDAESALYYSKKGDVKTAPGFEEKTCLSYVFIGLSFCRTSNVDYYCAIVDVFLSKAWEMS